MSQTIRMYVGTYTRPEGHVPEARGEGIYIFEFDAQNGTLNRIGLADGIESPSFLTIAPDQRHLYAVSEVSAWPQGTVTAYAIDASSGALTALNAQSAHGGSSAYISMDAAGQVVLVANYGSGSVAAYHVEDDGRLSSASDVHENDEVPDRSAAGIVLDRQEAPHAHCIISDPSNRYAVVCDLGLDKVMVYRLNTDNGQLTPHDPAFIAMPTGSGPRHIAFHPDGAYAYVVNELNSTVTVLAFDAEAGRFDILQTLSTLPDDFTGKNHGSDIHVSPSGRFVYAGNRGHDSISVFAVEGEGGQLRLIGHQSTKGKTPRNFTIDPTGNYLLAANQDSHTIATFRIDPENGLLSDTGIMTDCPTPVCLKMIAV